jgi:acetyl esterase/lipase
LQQAGERIGGVLRRVLRRPSSVEVVAIGDITLRLHRPAPGTSVPSPAMLWIHGGGYVIGTAAQDDALCRHLAKEAGILVAAVDYRLAPEHPYPTPLHDCYAGLAHLATRSDVDPARIIIGGASAGGGLAAGLAALARDRGEITPILQVLAYPMLDDRSVRRSFDERGFRLWTNASNDVGWRSYLGAAPGSDGVDGHAAPARIDDLAGLAPAWIGVGTLDLFHDEDVEYARRLIAAGTHCDLDVVEGAFHGFDAIAPRAGVSRSFRASQLRAIDAAVRAVGAMDSTARG